VRLLPYLKHSFWFLPTVAACHAMANLLARSRTSSGTTTRSLTVAGTGAGIGLAALPPVRRAIGRRPRHEDDHPVVREADHRRDGAAVVLDPDAAQPQLT
jgi:hypothetical protein